ncbi:MAG TPA: beta-galactosidase, partial [Nannocystaceae bacterium]|nr:beta-galactosidase [Nannocystaceae bacterium]
LAAIADEDVAPRVDDPRLQMWFLGNETGMFDHPGHDNDGVRDFRRWIWTLCPEASTIDAPQCAPHALAGFLRARYSTLGALNSAWESAYPGEDFATIVDVGPRPVPYEHDCNLTCREDLQRFVHDELLRRWVELVTTTVRATDPGHLLASPRMALVGAPAYRFWEGASSATPEAWYDEPGVSVPTDAADVTYCPFDLLARKGDAGFDLVAVNVYDGDPQFEEPWLGDGFRKLHERSGLPIVVSEFSIRARIDGWSNRGGAGAFVPDDDATDDQIQRGAYYRSQIEQFAAHPFVLGASWHAWSDRYDASDPAHQIDMGLLQCDDPARGFEAGQRWDELDDRIADTNCGILERIEQLTGS